MTKSIDEWAADKCGVLFPQHDDMNRWAMPNAQDWNKGKWTIKDPRCREIMLDWIADHPEYYRLLLGYINNWLAGKMKKEEAEIAAITAIYEAENTQEEPSNGNGND